MCGIAAFLGMNYENNDFTENALLYLNHRGPDSNGVYKDNNITLVHTRLSILELSEFGRQPMTSSCGRYIIVYNGEVYNHLELREKYLKNHNFKGHSDTETILELFRIKKESMLEEMVGMWSLIIWDMDEKKLFISRDRFGQKPLYVRRYRDAFLLSSEIKPLLQKNEIMDFDATAVNEYLALGNYGHLGIHTFFKDIKHFPQGEFGFLALSDDDIKTYKYWHLPNINEKDKVPFTPEVKKELHNAVVKAVLSQTQSDVPIGITLSGGLDSSIITGILGTYYKNDIHVFTAQSINSRADETKYVDAVIDKFNNGNFIIHRKNINNLSIKDEIEKYLYIQEEPFGDPSIIAHGFLMQMAKEQGIKVIIGGQGADELFFGYNNMTQTILLKQLLSCQFAVFAENMKKMNLGNSFLLRTLLKVFLPNIELVLRNRLRINKRKFINKELVKKVDNNLINLYKSNVFYDAWKESVFGVHLPHLVQYDDRNGMAYGVEGRMPYLDHRIVDIVGKIRSEEFIKHGYRKYMLREACKEYIPEDVYKRTDKIGFFTPLMEASQKDKDWILNKLKNNLLIKDKFFSLLKFNLTNNTLSDMEVLIIWRCLSMVLWQKEFNIKNII